MDERWIVDSSPSERHPIYTRANVGEVFPEPVAPLSGTMGVRETAEPGWRDAFERFGVMDPDEYDQDQIEILGIFGGYCYINVSISRIVGVRTPGLTPEAIDNQFFGEQPGVPPYEPQEGDESPEHTERVQKTLQWILTTDSLPELLDDQRLTEKLRDERPDVAALSDKELVDLARDRFYTHFRRLFANHIFTTYSSTVPVGIITNVCQAIGHPEYVLKLIAGVGDVESAAPSMALWDMGRLVASSDVLTAEFDRGVDGLLGRIEGSGDGDAHKFTALFADFVHQFGCRGPNEWEMRSPTWETKPEVALAAVDRMRLSPDSHAPKDQQKERAVERETLGAQVADQLAGDPETHGQFRAALRSATIFLAGRERSKTNAIRLVHEGRVLLHEVGRRMVERGVLDEPEDFGMIRSDELDEFLADPGSFTDVVRERRHRHAELLERVPPFIVVGEPTPPSTWPRRDADGPDQSVAGAVLQGVPGCAGKATGRARVILNPCDPTALEPGDVLVAPITDPAWTPLFVPAAAVVVDVGAPLSHAVIVSRELGIPCVVSVLDGTRSIPDGAMVTVDGDTGTVTIDSTP